MKNGQHIILGAMSVMLIFLFSIVGCSDPSYTGSPTSYTGSMLTAVDLDDYSTSIRGGRYCIYKDADSSCIDLVPLLKDKVDTDGPIIHIYPERTVYLFYHEGKPFVRVERTGDTTDFIDTLGDPDRAPPKRDPSTPEGDGTGGNNGNTGGNNGNTGGDNGNTGGDNGNTGGDNDNTGGDNDNTGGNNDNTGGNNDNTGGNNDNTGGNNDNTGDDNDNTGGDNDNTDDKTPEDADDNGNTPNTRDGHGWLIWIYYPEGTAPINPPTLSASNVTVTINGKRLADADITGFAQFIGSEGEKGIQFFYPTKSAELLDLNVQMIGITDDDGNVRFNINYLWRSY